MQQEGTVQLNEVQITLLRLFQREISEEQIQDIKKMLFDYYNQQLKTELASVLKDKQLTNKDFEEMLNDPNT